MKNSFFLKRILLLLAIALILWTGLTSALYLYIARPVFIRLKRNDLLPQAKIVARIASSSEFSTNETLNQLVQLSYQFYGSWIFITDVKNNRVGQPLPDNMSESTKEEINRQVKDLIGKIASSNQEQSFVHSPLEFKGDILYVAVPINVMVEETCYLIGSVVVVQPLNELNAGLRSLNIALLISALIVGIFLTIPAIIATRHIIKPLGRIRRVAVAMAQGDFSLRAETDEVDGEVSDLAQAINHLASQLNETIGQLTNERNQLKQIIDGIAEGIIAVDLEGKVTQINTIVWKMFQRNPDSYSADLLLEISRLKPLFDTCLASGEPIVEILEADQKVINCLISPLLDANLHVFGAVGLFRDVTESVHLEQTRRDYVANVSHELRTPITAMRGLLEPLYDDMVPKAEDRKRYYGILLRETLRLSRLVNDMLELSRLQSGQNASTQGPVHLEQLLNDLASRFAILAKEQDIRFDMVSPFDGLPPVWGNEDRIEQILVILFDNALKFTPEGGSVQMIVELLPDMCTISVKDTGIGISPDDIPYVFERFYKADKAHNESGTGLGLSIAQEIANQMGQVLSVASAPQEGSTFTLSLQYASNVMKKDRHLKDVYESDSDELK